jgi:hypothetical protein
MFEVESSRQQAVDTDQGAGLVMPLVTPAPHGEPVASFLPQRPEPREFLTQVDPPNQGRLLIEKGRLVYRGLVRPAGVRVRVVYVVPYDGHTEHTLGFRMPLPASSVAMVVRTSERVQPELAFHAPADVLVRPFMDGEQRTALLVEAPDAGEVVLFDVRQTPDRHVLLRPLAAGLGALLVAALLVLAIGRKREGSASTEPPSTDANP